MIFHATKDTEDERLLRYAVAAVQLAGKCLKDRFSVDVRPSSRDEIVAAVHANDAASLSVLRSLLLDARPGAHWAEDEVETRDLPPGEWWVTDAVEGNINHVQGMVDWCVTATLIREREPILTAVHLPLSGDTYSAVGRSGARLNGARIKASTKTDLKAALVGTAQAKPGESDETYRRIGQSVTAMLGAALVLRVAVPSTLQLVQIAAGRMDVFWQYGQVRSGLLAGALLVQEAGGKVTDSCGRPWSLDSEDFLAAAPGVHLPAVSVLAKSH